MYDMKYNMAVQNIQTYRLAGVVWVLVQDSGYGASLQEVQQRPGGTTGSTGQYTYCITALQAVHVLRHTRLLNAHCERGKKVQAALTTTGIVCGQKSQNDKSGIIIVPPYTRHVSCTVLTWYQARRMTYDVSCVP